MTDLTTTQFARRTALGLAGASGLAFLWPTAASAREFDRPYEGFAPPNTTLRAATAASVGLNQARIRRRLRSRPGGHRTVAALHRCALPGAWRLCR
ncbi:MAG TPA: hypothetical protein PLG38_03175 [Propionibacteriaceae bacterium]|nr:hypothetical protein [Propionibacteriaceae bacterium]